MATGENVMHGVGGHAAHIEAPPYDMPSRKFGMWLFIISDAITFAALLIAYAYLRLASPQWPRPFEFSSSIVNATIMTFILVTSSLTVEAAVVSAKRGKMGGAVGWLVATMAAGILFAILHLREWKGLLDAGVKLTQNPFGTPIFGAAFFGLTGMHIFHVIGGVVYLAVVAILVARGKAGANGISICALYWCFVDLVWMFIFPMVYLMSAKIG